MPEAPRMRAWFGADIVVSFDGVVDRFPKCQDGCRSK